MKRRKLRTVWPGDSYVDAAGPDYYAFNIDPNATGYNGDRSASTSGSRSRPRPTSRSRSPSGG